MEILKCTGVKKIYGKGENEVTALNGIDFQKSRGSLLQLWGHRVRVNLPCYIF